MIILEHKVTLFINSKLIIAVGDISRSRVVGRKFRDKIMKEISRCGKGIALTGSVVKPI